MDDKYEKKVLITNLCNQIIELDMNRYKINYITFKLKEFSFVEITICGLDKNFHSYFNMEVTDVPYFKLVELFNEIQCLSSVSNEENEILYPLECEIEFIDNLCFEWHVEFVSKNIDREDNVYSVWPEEWKKDIRL